MMRQLQGISDGGFRTLERSLTGRATAKGLEYLVGSQHHPVILGEGHVGRTAFEILPVAGSTLIWSFMTSPLQNCVSVQATVSTPKELACNRSQCTNRGQRSGMYLERGKRRHTMPAHQRVPSQRLDHSCRDCRCSSDWSSGREPVAIHVRIQDESRDLGHADGLIP